MLKFDFGFRIGKMEPVQRHNRRKQDIKASSKNTSFSCNACHVYHSSKLKMAKNEAVNFCYNLCSLASTKWTCVQCILVAESVLSAKWTIDKILCKRNIFVDLWTVEKICCHRNVVSKTLHVDKTYPVDKMICRPYPSIRRNCRQIFVTKIMST